MLENSKIHLTFAVANISRSITLMKMKKLSRKYSNPIVMIIGNPKVRKKMNSAVDVFCVGIFYLTVPFAIVAGVIVGGIGRLFKR